MSPNNLPMQLTSFVGREHQIADLTRLLRVSRLLTLTGTGGSGKTRLALQVASHHILYTPGECEHGVYFVSLAPLRDPRLFISSIAQTLAVAESPDQPIEEKLKAYLHDKRLLLLLDNFEQIVEAAPQVVDLLKSAPDLKVIVTSRASLRLSGEQHYTVQPLALPDLVKLPTLTALSQVESVTLFVQRAASVKSQFTLTKENSQAVAEICHRLDGLPLAIELAAARLTALTPQLILEKLKESLNLLTNGPRDMPARHQTLRSAIEWSYKLLNGVERKLFRRQSLFVGGATLEAIQAVCNVEASGNLEIELLDAVMSLIDKSLLKHQQGHAGEARFVMLQTIREYSLELLHESGEAHTIRHNHAQFYLTLAEALNKDARGPQQAGSLDRLESENDNFHAALQWSLSDMEDPELGIRLAAELGWFWFVRGRWGEGRRWLRSALSLNTPDISEQNIRLIRIRARALTAAGRLALKQGDYDEAETLLEECLMLRRKLGDPHDISGLLILLGELALEKGDFSQARSCFEESLANCRKQGDKRGIAEALSNLSLAIGHQGDPHARALMNESIQMLSWTLYKNEGR